jgi:hypothetical protein
LTVYAEDVEAKRLELHSAILANQPPAGQTRESLGASRDCRSLTYSISSIGGTACRNVRWLLIFLCIKRDWLGLVVSLAASMVVKYDTVPAPAIYWLANVMRGTIVPVTLRTPGLSVRGLELLRSEDASATDNPSASRGALRPAPRGRSDSAARRRHAFPRSASRYLSTKNACPFSRPV